MEDQEARREQRAMPRPRRTPHRVPVAALLVALMASVSGSAAFAAGEQEPPVRCECPDPFDRDTPPGIVWEGPGPAPDLPAIAERLAPILWFSSDEPLIVLRGAAIPQPHPCDEPRAGPIVYYQATSLVLRGGDRVDGTGEEDAAFFDKVDHFVLRFYFYYEEDYGLRPHPHDLEVVNLLVYLEQTPEGCFRVRVARIEGLAHGVDWYTNILRVERDTVFPITILVEEGKHANVPDRNGDGVYTPGYDVNVRVNDAWGLRDVLASSLLLGARYTASMSKPREEAFRLLPPSDAAVCGVPRRQRHNATTNLGRYELRPAAAVPICTPPGPEPERLLGKMRGHRFGRDYPPHQHGSELERVLGNPENIFRWFSAINARYDSDNVGASLQGPGMDLRELWVVPRVHLIGRGWGIEALLTASASRWIDTYGAMGYERGLILAAPMPGAERAAVNAFAVEGGIKFRLTASGRARWALLGYRFGGVRLGLRANGFSRLRHPRLVAEVGAGAF